MHRPDEPSALRYTRDHLLALRLTDPAIKRPARKALFCFNLWRPVRHRILQTETMINHFWPEDIIIEPGNTDTNINVNITTADHLTIGYLNAQSISNKSA